MPSVTDSPPEILASLTAEVDRYLDALLRRLELPGHLGDAIAYALAGGGKRLRPVLALLSCEAVGGDRARALGPAASLELVHTFSLVHDDLPAMDDDDLRRGRATLHVRAGEAMAILAGDAMLSLAFQLIADTIDEPASVKRLISELGAGTTAMIVGQVYDTLGGFATGLSAREKLDLIHRHKTGALIRAACRMGAICGGANARDLDRLTHYGEAIGLMFQIVDDLLDVTQSAEHIGKATGKDEQAGKVTFPGVMGVEASRREVLRLQEAARAAIEPLGERSRPLAQLADYLAVRTR